MDIQYIEYIRLGVVYSYGQNNVFAPVSAFEERILSGTLTHLYRNSMITDRLL